MEIILNIGYLKLFRYLSKDVISELFEVVDESSGRALRVTQEQP